MKANTNRRILRLVGLLLLGIILFSATGCGGGPKITVSAEEGLLVAVNDAINKLSSNSADWMAVLQDLQSQLTSDMKEIIGNDISNLIIRAEAAAGAEVRCNAEFIRARVRRDLINLKASILNQEPSLEVEPYFCHPIPSHIDMNLAPDDRNVIEFYGFDFDVEPGIKIYHQVGNQFIDMSKCIDDPSHFMLTLNLGGDCIVLGPESKRLIAKWNGKEYQSVGVIQPHPKICEQIVKHIDLDTPLDFSPTIYYGGDKDYHGNGPEVDLGLLLKIIDGGIDAKVTLIVQETKDDWTEARGQANLILYRPTEPGWRVVEIISPAFSNISYIDTDEKSDIEYPDGPINHAEIWADASGDKDVDKTKARIYFSRIYFTEVEYENCVTQEEYDKLSGQGFLSGFTISELKLVEVPEKSIQEGIPFKYSTQTLPPGFNFFLPTPTP